MRKYIGAANAKRGLEFTKAVAKRLDDSGYKVWIEIEMGRLRCPKDQASDDIDVIAEKDGIVFLSECKELSFALTITEVVEQLGRFKEKPGDDLWKTSSENQMGSRESVTDEAYHWAARRGSFFARLEQNRGNRGR